MELPTRTETKGWTKECIHSEFDLPIYFNEEKTELEEHIKIDLELNVGESPLYNKLLETKILIPTNENGIYKFNKVKEHRPIILNFD